MKKITSFLLLFLFALTSWAQGGGTTKDVPVNPSTGKFWRGGSIEPNPAGKYVKKWESTEIPGLTLEYSTGQNQMKATATGIAIGQMNNTTHFFSVKLTGDAAVKYRLLGYTATSTKGQLLPVDAADQNHTFTADASSHTFTHQGDEVTELRFKNGTNTQQHHYSDDATFTIHLEEMPTTMVTYTVKDGNDVVFTSQPTLTRQGAFVVPAMLKRPLTTLTAPDGLQIAGEAQSVELAATFEGPFAKENQQLPYMLVSKSKYFVVHKDNETPYRLSMDTYYNGDEAKWIFSGNPYQGVSIKNVANNKYLKKGANNAVTAFSTTPYLWEVDLNKVTPRNFDISESNIGKGFTLNDSTRRPANVNVPTLKDWQYVDHNSIFYALPAADVTYTINKAGESTQLLQQRVVLPVGSPKLPAPLRRPFTTYAPVDVDSMLPAGVTALTFEATFTAPFDGKEYLVKDGSGHYLNYQEGQTSYTLTKTEDFNENYRWKFEGNPYQGVSVKSEAGNGYLKMTNANATGQTTGVNVQQVAASESTFEINTVGTNGGVSLKQGRFYLNVHGSTKALQGYHAVDANSTLYIIPVPDNFKEKLVSEFGGYHRTGEALPLFDFLPEKRTEFNTKYDEYSAKASVSFEEYNAVKTIVENPANYNFPETGYYRIFNAATEGKYLYNYRDSLKVNMTQEQAEAAPGSVFLLTRSGEAGSYTYTIKVSDKYVPKKVNHHFDSLSDQPAEAFIKVAALGECRINVDNATKDERCYITHNGVAAFGAAMNYNNSEGNSRWKLAPATTVTLPLTTVGEASYATAYLPFNVTLPQGAAKAYAVNKTTGDETEMTTGVAKGTGVVIRDEQRGASVVLNITTDDIQNAATSDLEGTYFAKTVQESTLLTFGASQRTEGRVGFFNYLGTDVPAYRAYITKSAGGMEQGFDLFDGVTGIATVATTGEEVKNVYDLTGRRVKNAARGLFIVNGKKVVR